MTAQLTLDGDEVAVDTAAARVVRGGAERAVMRALVDAGGVISSTQAGRVVHRQRHARHGGACRDPYLFGEGCCRHAAGDGIDVLKRLARRRLVERVSRGTWTVLQPGEQPTPVAA